MKTIPFYIIALLLFFSLTSCEDVIEVDLPTEEPRLIIDALIRVPDTTAPSTLITVKVSETNSFLGSVPPANLQQITMSNLDNPGGDGQVLLEEEPGSGIYSKFFPTDQLIRDRWFLQIDFEDNFYVAETSFVPTSNFDTIEFGDGTLFNENDTEIILSFTDNAERDDYYLIDFDFNDFLVTEDEFYQGQQFGFSYFYEEDVVSPGDVVELSIMGITEDFAAYMDLLLEQSEGGFGPFQTPAVTVRGNFINATNIDNDGNFDNVGDPNNFALGYFAIVQEYKQSLTIE